MNGFGDVKLGTVYGKLRLTGASCGLIWNGRYMYLRLGAQPDVATSGP